MQSSSAHCCPVLCYLFCSLPHLDLHSFPTRRSSDLSPDRARCPSPGRSIPTAAAHTPASTASPAAPIATSTSTPAPTSNARSSRSEEHTSELQSRFELVCRLLLEKKKLSKSYAGFRR